MTHTTEENSLARSIDEIEELLEELVLGSGGELIPPPT